MEEYVIECKNVSKAFEDVKVLNDVCFGVRVGEILVLLGEHGAGKSTLMKCLFGMYRPDAGEILLSGRPVSFRSPKNALESGVSIIFQEPHQVLQRNVMENLWLGRFPKLFGFVSHRQMFDQTQAVFDELGLKIDPKAIMAKLSLSQRQMVEIAKALAVNARVLILDEPASILTAKETENLFVILRMLRDKKGIGIVYLCHRVDELLNIADRVAIMRHGSIVKSAAFADFTMEELISSVGMQHFADNISETRALARILTGAFSKKSPYDSPDEEMTTALHTLSSALIRHRSRAEEREADEQGRLLSMRDFIDAFSVMIEQLSERYQALLEAKFEAEAASKSKSAFLATMSHEIRTPLNAIIGLSEIQLQKQLPSETRIDLEKIHLSGTTLLGIINDILDISKIEAGSFDLVPAEYDVPKLINDVVQLNVVRIGSKNIAFGVQVDETIPVKLYGDELRIRQVLNNLLSNAFKYTMEGKVLFCVEWRRESDFAELAFVVADTGMGIKKEDLRKLFSEYTQLDTRASRYIEGTGLGLSITKKLLDLMDGTVTVESEYGKGSTFTVSIRQQIVEDAPIGKNTAENLKRFRFMKDRGSVGKNIARSYMPYGKVLVADDMPSNLDVAKGLMLPYGMTIDVAKSGKEAIEIIREGKTRYDVVFMDHMMPEMDGVEATRVIRSEIGTEYARTVPIVALTANALAGNKEMFLANGFNDFLSKPIDITKLDMVLNQWVRDKQNEETLRLAEQSKPQIKAEDNKQSVMGSTLERQKVNGIDLAAGIERYNDEALYFSMLNSFAYHTPKLLTKLREIGEKNLTEYAITVHGIKGSAYGICAIEAGNRAEALELAAKAGNYEMVSEGNGAFLELMEKLIGDLTEFLRQAEEKFGVNTPKKKLPEPSDELLQELLEATTHFRTSQMGKIVTVLKMYEYETGGELINWLEEQMDNLDYDAMRERLSQFLKNSK